MHAAMSTHLTPQDLQDRLAVLTAQLQGRVLDSDGNEVGSKEYLYQTFFVPYFADPRNASLAGALTFVLIWLAILWMMYRKGVIIKV